MLTAAWDLLYFRAVRCYLISGLRAFIARLRRYGANRPLDHEAAGSQFWPCGVGELVSNDQAGVQDLVLEIKRTEQDVSPPSAQHLQLPADSRSSSQWWGEPNQVLEDSWLQGRLRS